MILYHRTTAANAEQILRDGFCDGVGAFMTTQEHSGVWLSNVQLDINEGAEGDTLLQVELPDPRRINRALSEGRRSICAHRKP
jgi:hypothetical protein